MAITKSGFYGLTLEKMLIDTSARDLEAETNKLMLIQDAETPDFTLDDFRDDVSSEVTGTNYSAGGVAYTGTDLTLSGDVMTYDASVDTVFSNVTISSAMAGVGYADVGTAGTDQLFFLSDFVTAASATAADFTVQWHANGILTITYA